VEKVIQEQVQPGDGYKMAEELGHTITEVKPSLVALTCKGKSLKICKSLQGLSLRNVGIKFINDKKVLYDDFGKLRLSYIEFLKVGLVVDAETAESFDYSSSIDGETYNRIKLVRENEKTGKRDVYIAQSGDNMNKWGVLQYFDTVDENMNASAKANALLKLYNQKTKSFFYGQKGEKKRKYLL